ncbi:hypothetical protein RB200_24610 [Streptomyces sp. PmtG]
MEEGNRCVDVTRPWDLAKAERAGDRRAGDRLDHVLAALLHACRALAGHLAPFVPDAAALIAAQCAETDGRVPAPRPLFARVGEPRGLNRRQPSATWQDRWVSRHCGHLGPVEESLA